MTRPSLSQASALAHRLSVEFQRQTLLASSPDGKLLVTQTYMTSNQTAFTSASAPEADLANPEAEESESVAAKSSQPEATSAVTEAGTAPQTPRKSAARLG